MTIDISKENIHFWVAPPDQLAISKENIHLWVGPSPFIAFSKENIHFWVFAQPPGPSRPFQRASSLNLAREVPEEFTPPPRRFAPVDTPLVSTYRRALLSGDYFEPPLDHALPRRRFTPVIAEDDGYTFIIF